jgi:diguanylate cyclase (GGDEF)-like protein
MSDRIRVLLVEASPEYALLVEYLLRDELGGAVEIDRRDSVEAARDELHDDGVDCLLLDLSLRSEGGLAPLHEVRARAPRLPVVVLSAEGENELAVRALREGAQDYVVKRDAGGPLLGRAIRYAMDRKRSELALAHQATHDALTGLPNRTLFADRLRRTLARVERRELTCAVLFLDLDRFKVVNDSLGHDVGDQLLVAAAERLRDLVRPSDTVARFGGDDFMVLCDDVASDRDAVVVAERIAGALAEPFEVDGREVLVGASIGIALAGDGSHTAETLVRDADQTMHRAKERGSRWELFDPETLERANSRLSVESELHRALARRELRVYYQPEVDLRTGRVLGVESLVRWQHPERGMLPPGEFIPFAEESGLIVEIGEWVIEEACTQLARWRALGVCDSSLTVNVNLSARQLSEPNLAATVARILDSTGVPPANLCLELTETAVVSDVDRAAEVLDGLKRVGVTLSLDDFGTGYSSLSVLDRYPLDTIKIDRSFVRRLGSGERADRLFTAIVGVAHALKLRTVAEGVETREQLAHVARVGCDTAQGFYLARPEDPGVVGELLAETLVGAAA